MATPRGATIRLKSAFDGFELGAYHVAPTDARHGGLVLIQEIFGVTDHIRELCDGFAEDGYEVIAPSFYDRQDRGFSTDYGGEGVAKAMRYSAAAPWDEVAGDIQAAVRALKGPVFVTGFCWGGTASWLAACRCEGLAAASSFYGRRIPELLAETPRCPIILHFGKTDASIPLETVEQIRAARPEMPIYLYDAGHGFVSDRRADHDPDSARLARLRTLQLFQRTSGVREGN
jgi:carboxymethylenebutenolidase